MAVDPIDMHSSDDRLLARVVQVFGAAQAHHGYLFANTRSNVRIASSCSCTTASASGVRRRRLNTGGFIWPREAPAHAGPVTRTREREGAADSNRTTNHQLIHHGQYQRLERVLRLACAPRLG